MSYKKHKSIPDVTSVTLLWEIMLESKHVLTWSSVVFYVFLLELLTVACGASASFMWVCSLCVYTAIMQISHEIPHLQTHAEHALIW